MAANEHLQPKQLSFLMPAHEVAKMQYGDATTQRPADRKKVLAKKQSENETYGPPADMDRPLAVWHDTFNTTPTIYDGHHRLAQALATDPNREMLVSHDDETSHEMMKARMYRKMG